MYRNNGGDRPPRRMGVLGWLIGALHWLDDRFKNPLIFGFGDRLSPSRHSRHSDYDPNPDLPHAELTEEERGEAVEEIRRRPRIG